MKSLTYCFTRMLGAVVWITAGLAAFEAHAAARDAIPDTPSPNIEPSIPFANNGGIFDWRADGTRGIWLQAIGGKWYYGTFVSPCMGLNFAETVGFKTNPSGSFDHWSTVLVHNEIPCRLTSFTESEAPRTGAHGRSGETLESASN